MVGDDAGFLVIDDTALPKKGRHSIGVAPQYASSLGKTANCQSLVSLTLASQEVPVMVGLRLFLPESWTNDPERMARARVPKDRQTALTKPEIAIEEIDRVIASGARFGCVLADSGYGSSGPFRQALSERGLLWAVGLSRRQNVYPADIALIFPIAKTGKPRSLARRSGSSASGGQPGSKNTMCRTCRPMPPSRRSLPRSRPGGSVNRPTSSSRRSLGSTTSKVDPGRDCIDTR